MWSLKALHILSVLLLFILTTIVNSEATVGLCIVNILSNEVTGNETIFDAFREGVQAAFYAQQSKTPSIPLKIIPTTENITNVDNLELAMKKGFRTCALSQFRPGGVLGPFNDDFLEEAINYSSIWARDFMILSPYTEKASSRKWNKRVFFTRADPRMEMLSLLHYAVNKLAFRRIGFMYLQDAEYGDEELALLQIELKVSFNTSAIVFSQKWDETLNDTLFDDFISQKPEAIIIFGAKYQLTVDFIKKIVTDPSLQDILLLAPYALQQTLLTTYNDLIDKKTITKVNPTVITGTNPLPTATMYSHVNQFREEMTDYIKSKKSTISPNNINIFDENLNFGEALLSGWIAGSLLTSIALNANKIGDANFLQNYLFNQNRFIVGNDFILGDYGGECTKDMQEQGFICECNQGGHAVFLKSVNENHTLSSLTNTLSPYDTSSCYPTQYIISKAVQLLLLMPEDDKVLTSVGNTMLESMARAVAQIEESNPNSVTYNVKELNTSKSNDLQDYKNYVPNNYVDVVFGPISYENTLAGNCVIDPVYNPLQFHRTETNLIHIVPTIEQQIYTLYEFMTKNNGVFPANNQKVNFVLRSLPSTDDDEYRKVIEQTVRVLKVSSYNVVSSISDSIEPSFDKQGINFIIGLTETDIQIVTNFLSAPTSNASVILTYQDTATYYSTIIE